MITIDATALRRTLSETLDNVVEHNETVMVTAGKGNAVILSEKNYNAMVATIDLSSRPGLAEKIKEGDAEDPRKMARFDANEAW